MSEFNYQSIDAQKESDTILETDDLIEKVGESVTVAGVVQKVRKLGNLTFLVMRTFKDKLQIVFLGEKVDILGNIKEGNFIEVEGQVTANAEAYRGIEVVAEKIKRIGGITDPRTSATDGFHQTQEFSDPKKRAHLRVKTGIARSFSDCMSDIHLTQVPSIRSCYGGTADREPKVLRGFGELAYRQSFLPTFGGVYTVSPDNDELACEIGYQTSFRALMSVVVRFMTHLGSLKDGPYSRELSTLGADLTLPQAIPAVDFEEVRKRVMDVFGYRSPNKTTLLPEEMDLIGRLVREETGSGMIFVTRPPSRGRPVYAMRSNEDDKHTEEFSLIAHGRQIISGGLRVHDFDTQMEILVECGVPPTLAEEYMQAQRMGIPPHGGITVQVNPLLASLAGVSDKPRIHFPNGVARTEVRGEEEFNVRDFLFGLQKLPISVLESRAKHVQSLEDAQVASLMVAEDARDAETGLPNALVAILPEFAMSVEDVEFLLDLVPSQREKVLSEPPEKLLQYLWSILGHDHVKSIMKSQQMRRAVKRLSEMGILTDYGQLKFLHEEMLDNFDKLSVLHSSSIDADKLTEITCKRIAARKGSTPDPDFRSKIKHFLETTDVGHLVEFDEEDRRIVGEVLENGKKRAQIPLTKFTKRLLSSRPNTMATVMHTMTELAASGEALPIDGEAEEVLWEAIDAGCSTPVLYRAYIRLRANKGALTSFNRLLRDNFSSMHRNKEMDPREVSEKFYKEMEAFREYLGSSFFEERQNVYPELVHYFYRPVNMDISTLSSHLSSVGDRTSDLEELGFDFGGDHWEPNEGCYSFAYEEGDADKVMQLYFTKSSAGFFGKTSAGICTLNDQDLFKRKDHFHINLVDGATQLVVGNVQGYVINRDGKKVILIRAINPSESYVTMTNAQDILKSVVSAVVELAERSGVDEICIGESKGVWHAHSSREPIKAILDLLYENLEELTLETPFPIYNFYGVDKTIQKVYKFWEKQSVV